MNALGGEVSFQQRTTLVSLFPAEQRVVAQLLAIPPLELGTMTSSDLSQRSGASRSSIDRLSRKLGYAGLKDMRKALLMAASRDGRQADDTGSSADTPAAVARRVMSALARRAEVMARTLGDGRDIEAFVDLLLAARSIVLFGAGESAVVCSAIYMRLVRLGLPINFAEEHHTQVTLASLLGPQDVAVAVSFSGGSRSTFWATKIAKQNGTRIAVITGLTNSVLARLADLVIALPSENGLPGSAEILDRTIAGALAEVLFQCVTLRRPDLLRKSVRIDDTFNERRS